jgi:hypothetical protein
LPELTNVFRCRIARGSKIASELLSAAYGFLQASEISATIVDICNLALVAVDFRRDIQVLDDRMVSELSYFQVIKSTHEQPTSMESNYGLLVVPDFKEKEKQIYQQMDEIKDYWRMLDDPVYRAKINKKNHRLYKSERASELPKGIKILGYILFIIVLVAILAVWAISQAPPINSP